MAGRLAAGGRLCFSVFKKKCVPLENKPYASLSHFYTELHSFEQSLSDLEKLKLPKKLQDYDRKFRKLYRSSGGRQLEQPLTLTHSYEYYCRLVDEVLFGTEEVETSVSGEQLLELTRSMLRHDLDPYHQLLVPHAHTHPSLCDQLTLRFMHIEERLARLLFKDYTRFSAESSRGSLFQEREYKGDFKFELVDCLDSVEQLSEAIYNVALFGRARNKLILAAEMAVARHWQGLSELALGRLLFCLAMGGRSLKVIETNFQAIAERMRDHKLELLFYMVMSGVEDAVLFNSVSKTLQLQPRNTTQQLVSTLIQKILAQRFNCAIEVDLNEQYKLPHQQHGGEAFFEGFLARHNYTYSINFNPIVDRSVFVIQEKEFLVLDHRLVK